MSNRFNSLGMLVALMIDIILIVILVSVKISPILILIIIIVILIQVILKDRFLKVVIFITGRILMLAIRIVVIVVLVIPSSELVKHVNVFGVFDSEALFIGKFNKNLKPLRIWRVVSLHF